MTRIRKPLGTILGSLLLVMQPACVASLSEDTQPPGEAAEAIIGIPGGNLTSNPSFEASLTGWTGWHSNLARVSLSSAPNGSFVTKVKQNQGTSYSIGDSPATVSSTVAGEVYEGAAYVRAASNSATGKPVYLVLRERAPSGVVLTQTLSPAVTLSNAFQRVGVGATAINSGDALEVYVYQDGSVFGNAFYIDLITVVPVAPAGTGCQPAYGTFRAGNWPSGCWRPYADTSPFNAPIPATPKVAANSSQVVSYLNMHLPGPNVLQVIDTSIAPQNDYGNPTYYPNASDPLFTLHCSEPWGTCAIEGLQIRIPDAARPAGGSDHHLTAVDQLTGWEYDLWKVMTKPAGGGLLTFGWGGRAKIDGDGLGGEATAAGYGRLGGIIRENELEAGIIRHALYMVVGCVSSSWVWPAEQAASLCSNQGLPDTNAPPNGAHFQLVMSDAEISALAVPAWKKTILTAMAHYGLFVGDTSGDRTWQVQPESGEMFTSLGYTDPFVAFAEQNGIPLTNGQYRFDVSSGIDWTRLRMLDPCVSRGTCP